MEAVPEWPRYELAPPRRWFVLVTFSGLERVAKKHLEDAGMDTFLPLVETDRKRPPQGRAADLPYIVVPRFPGYLFVQLAPADAEHREAYAAQWFAIRSARGVLHALTSEGGRPIPVPSKQINRWLEMADKDGIVEHWRAPQPETIVAFDYGAVVRIKAGPYFDPDRERIGVVDKQKGEVVKVVFTAARWELRWDQIEEVL